MKQVVQEIGQTIVMVTHDPIAASYASRVVFLADGKVLDELRDPQSRHDPRQDAPTGRRVDAVMFKVTWKGLIAHKLRFVLTGIAVILGVAFISGTFVFTATIQQTFDDLIANIYKGTDAQVRGPEAFKNDQGGPGRNPAAADSRVGREDRRTAPGVEAAQGNVQIEYAQLVDHKGKAIGNPGQGAPALGFGWNPVKQLNQFNLVVGGHPPRNANEIVIDKGSADKGHLHVGETVKVLTGLPPKSYKIVGIARFGTADNLAGASIVLFTLPEAQRIAGLPGKFDYIGIVAKPGVSQDEVAANVRTTLREHGLGTLDVVTGKKLIEENQSQIGKALGFLNTGLLIFAFVALIVGAFIIYNTFSIVVAQRTREMALLRAIGASTRQVLGSIIGESLVIGVIASAIGVFGGIALAIGLRWVMSLLGIDLPGSGAVVPAKAVVWGMLVGTIVTLLSSIVPARNAARVPPVAALRDVAIEQPIRKGVRLGIGGGLGVLGLVALLEWALRRRQHLVRDPRRGADLRRRLRARPAVRALRELGARRADRAHEGDHRHARSRERGPQSQANVGDGGRAHDRRRARRLHHGLRDLGEAIVPRRDRCADHERLRHQQRRQLRRHRAQPAARPRDREAAGNRFFYAGASGHRAGEQRSRPDRRRRPGSRAEALRLQAVAGSLSDLGTDGIAVSKKSPTATTRRSAARSR